MDTMITAKVKNGSIKLPKEVNLKDIDEVVIVFKKKKNKKISEAEGRKIIENLTDEDFGEDSPTKMIKKKTF